MKTCRILLAATALSLTLSGCSFFRGLAHFDREPTPRPALATGDQSFTDEGRSALAADEYGHAIQSFQTALAAGESRAPALNGLGVAFARLGRYDLAERYFQGAMALAPDDARYRGNLARLMASPAYAMRHDADRVRMAGLDPSTPAQPEAATQPAAVRAEVPVPRPVVADGQIEKVGAHQFFIKSAAPQTAPSAAVVNALPKGYRPQVRVALAPERRNDQGKAAGPADLSGFRAEVRVALPEATAGK